MKNTQLFFFIITMLLVSSCNSSDVELIKQKAPSHLTSQGYIIQTYQGYENGLFGGYCWYTVKDSSGYIYELALMEYDNELHTYNLRCLNAVSK